MRKLLLPVVVAALPFVVHCGGAADLDATIDTPSTESTVTPVCEPRPPHVPVGTPVDNPTPQTGSDNSVRCGKKKSTK